MAFGSIVELLPGQTSLFNDGRINPDAVATVVAYCDKENGIEAYLPNGKQIFKVTAEQVENALKQAADSHKNILIKQASGQQLWALSNGELQLHDATGNGYNAVFAGDRCGE